MTGGENATTGRMCLSRTCRRRRRELAYAERQRNLGEAKQNLNWFIVGLNRGKVAIDEALSFRREARRKCFNSKGSGSLHGRCLNFPAGCPTPLQVRNSKEDR